MRVLRSVQAKLLLGFAAVITLVVVLMLVCQVAWNVLFDPAACRSVGLNCLALAGFGHGTPVWPPPIAVAVSLLAGLLLARRITRPLKEVTTGKGWRCRGADYRIE